MSKLTTEQMEDLHDLLHHEGIQSLFIEMDSTLENVNQSVLKYNLENGSADRLVQLKCRAEGAAAYVLALRNRLDTIKRPLVNKKLLNNK